MKKSNYLKLFIFTIVLGFIVKLLIDILPLEKTGITHIEWIVYVILGLIAIPFIYRYLKRLETKEEEKTESA